VRGLAALAVALVLAAGPAGAQFTPNYRDTDLRQVVEAVGAVTGRNFLLDTRVRNINVTFLTNTPLSEDALYEAFLTMLSMNNLVAIDDGEFTRIVPDAAARTLPSPVDADFREALVTQVMRVNNVSANQIVPALRPLMGQQAHLVALPNSNVLVLVDRLSNVERLMSIIEVMDRDAEQDIEVIRLEHAFAGDVVRTLTAMAQGAQAATGGLPPVQLQAHERTNSVLLSGSQAERLRYRALIAFLDEPVQGGGDTTVHFLRYADAEELATRLNEQFGARAPTGPGGAPPEGALPDEGPVQIWPHPPTNALVISAPARVMQNILAVVNQIDIPRAQVQVNAIIVEMSEEKAAQLGVTWAIDGSDDDNAIGLTNFGSTTPGIVQLGAAAQGDTPSPAAIPEGGVFAVGRIRDAGTSWAAIVSALRGDGTVNIISEPQIMVLDNAEAEQHVGQQVPFRTGEYAQVGQVPGAINPFTTIQREDVGTTLTITPQINEGNGMILSIQLEQSSIAPGAQGAADLITNTRRITTEVFAEDGEIIVLGGLIDDQLRQNEQRVPGLGRIPGLGWLFRARNTERSRTNMMMFIRPVILRDSVQRRGVTTQKYEYFRQLQLEQSERPIRLMREETVPLLPDLETIPAPQPAPPNSSGEQESDPNDGD